MLEAYEKYAPVFLRVGIGLVWFLFGIDKFYNPINWIGYIPPWMPLLFSRETFVFMLAIVETIIGLLLLIGLWRRFAAVVSILMLIPIIVSVIPISLEIAIRDTGLLLSSIALFLRRETPFSVDSWMRKGRMT